MSISNQNLDLMSAAINWPVLIIVGILALALLIFLVRRNQKDKKSMEKTMNQVDPKPLDHGRKVTRKSDCSNCQIASPPDTTLHQTGDMIYALRGGTILNVIC